jgi:hypothetical protein
MRLSFLEPTTGAFQDGANFSSSFFPYLRGEF